jgi:hypothetical protein
MHQLVQLCDAKRQVYLAVVCSALATCPGRLSRRVLVGLGRRGLSRLLWRPWSWSWRRRRCSERGATAARLSRSTSAACLSAGRARLPRSQTRLARAVANTSPPKRFGPHLIAPQCTSRALSRATAAREHDWEHREAISSKTRVISLCWSFVARAVGRRYFALWRDAEGCHQVLVRESSTVAWRSTQPFRATDGRFSRPVSAGSSEPRGLSDVSSGFMSRDMSRALV